MRTGIVPVKQNSIIFIASDSGYRHTEMANAVKINESLIQKHPSPDRRNTKIGGILTNIAKFAVDSTVNDSIKGVTGLTKLYKIVQERLADAPNPLSLNLLKKPEDLEPVKKMELRMEEMQEEMSKLKQLNTASQKLDEAEPGKKKPNEGYSTSDLPNTHKKRIFIRSRL